ncbi:MAG: hypothetical protein SFY80_00840 [Verrucomicrobiota bacterium]|nr:hypothetical protein [Verrucomicrobiota bacterium]
MENNVHVYAPLTGYYRRIARERAQSNDSSAKDDLVLLIMELCDEIDGWHTYVERSGIPFIPRGARPEFVREFAKATEEEEVEALVDKICNRRVDMV